MAASHQRQLCSSMALALAAMLVGSPCVAAFIPGAGRPLARPVSATGQLVMSSFSSYQSFQPLGAPKKMALPTPGFTLGLQNETAGTDFEEYIVNITQPLGIFIEESPDKSGMVYVAEVGEKAAAQGVEVGDVIVAASFVFGDDYLVNVAGKGVDKVQSMIRSRAGGYVCLRLRRGCDYHLLEAIPELMEDEERGMKAEEKESQWIRTAKKIFIDEYPVDLSAIEQSAVDDDDDP